MKRLVYFLIWRVAETILLFWLKYLGAYSEKDFRIVILTLTAVTALVLVANFSTYKKHEKYNPVLDWGFGIFISVLFLLEISVMIAAPKGYISFGTSQWIIGGVEFVFTICLGFLKRLELL